MATPFDWRLDDIERTAKNAERRLYELDENRRSVDRLECSVRELSTCVDGLRAVCEAQQTRIEQLERQLVEIQPIIQ